MTIQCPNCQQECPVPDTSTPTRECQVQCEHCRLSFSVRAHDSGSAQANRPTPAPSRTDTRSPTDSASEVPIPTAGTVQPIPSWIPPLYEPPPETQSAPLPDRDQEILTGELHPKAPEEDRVDIPCFVDDTEHEDPLALPEDPLVPSSGLAGSRETGKLYRAARNHRRWVLPAAITGAGLCVLLLLALLGRQGVVQKGSELASSFRSLMPFQSTAEGTLNFSEHRSEFVSRRAGAAPLFVIQGKVTNNYPRPCHSIRVRGTLFDERGKPANEEIAYCGNILTRKELTGKTEEAIRKRLQNPLGANLSNLNIQPGKSIPFMLVFFSPPEKPSEFSIEIAGYSLQEASSE